MAERCGPGRRAGTRRWAWWAAAVLCPGLVAAGPARAWPDRPVQLVVPFPPGGLIDIVARGFAQALADRLGVSVAVVNRDGAAGAIAGRAVATARPDGYALGFFSAGAITTQPSLVRGVGYTVESFQPICQVFSGGYALVSGRGGPTSAAEAIEAARRQPGAVALGFPGNGTPAHWILIGMQRAAGVQFNAVPFRGDPPVVTALLGGELALGVLGTGSAVSSGLPVLLSFTSERDAAITVVPTAREIGLPVEEAVFGGLIAPAGLPVSVTRLLEAACAAATQDARVTETLRTARLDRTEGDARRFGAALAADAATKRELARLAGLLVE